ncbi:MAG: transglutaminase family protein [Halioglobus sp.]|jgi:transglutaminase-like putative cysteine protease
MSAPHPTDEDLAPGRFIDSGHPAIIAQTEALVRDSASQLENAVSLYYWVRDSIRYNPYTAGLDPASFLASTTLQAGEGWCVPKALLLSALCRAAGIPAHVGFADVRNHLSTARMRAVMQTDVFYFHGYSVLYLEDRWVKATPAFNIELCEKFGLCPLEFNGREDSLYHPFDLAGHRHMEYLNDRGAYPDLPFEELVAVFHRHYPNMFDQASAGTDLPDRADWNADVARETGS